MSDLQIGLLGVGAVAVAGVYLFNVWQERQFRRRAEEAFPREHDDILMRETATDSLLLVPARSEPSFNDNAEPVTRSVTSLLAVNRKLSLAVDPAIDYVIEVHLATPDTGARLYQELSVLTVGWQRPVLVEGSDDGSWQRAGRDSGSAFPHLRCAVQISNRSGYISQQELLLFRDVVLKWAEQNGATAIAGDIEEAQQKAATLDALCAEVDIAIGINVISREGSPFHGSRIRALAEAAGLKLEADGVFSFLDQDSAVLFTLDNHEPMPFVPEQMSTLQTHGVTFLLDLPRTTAGPHAFDSMLRIARDFALALGGTLVDDNRAPLSEGAIDKIRRQLLVILEKMDMAGVSAGSARALRLFS